MPANRNALVRYKTIDQCLKNRFRQWTLDDLVEACSEALYEYEGIDKGVSKRTVQLDIQMMRSDKLGYNAPIIVKDRKYYTYEDPNYSITNIPLTDQDLRKLSDAVDILKQFKGFTQVQELSGMIQKLEDSVQSKRDNQMPIIQFETNNELKGLEYLEPLYESVLHKRSIKLTYKSFKAREESTFDFHPQLLKEFRNRWFVLGFKNAKQNPMLLAFDRIINLDNSECDYIGNTRWDLVDYFKHAIGVSVEYEPKIERIELFVEKKHAPYVLTKPIHHSQKKVRDLPGGIVVSMYLQLNYELEKEILGFGEAIKVLRPARLQKSIQKRLMLANRHYQFNINGEVINEAFKRVQRKGYASIDEFYTIQEIQQIRTFVNCRVEWEKPVLLHIDRPESLAILFNDNLQRFIDVGLGNSTEIIAALFYQNALRDDHHQWQKHHQIPDRMEEEEIIWRDVTDEEYRKLHVLTIFFDHVDESTGAIHVKPRSHWDQEEEELDDKTVVCAMRPGGVHIQHAKTTFKYHLEDEEREFRAVRLYLI
ncbi:helix-turn-helix transcriptional regulator [Aureibacter tunicatorum]|uniref:DNA-binding transcriptional regulator YafY n=1 Tax=Aureibacter tunicatorum TaxID=866807 RepID=A0AAE4BU67_9BACT|nr:WYL domain-containing protein [Aureibacter tunicatorum]MDR6240387.1 putative DNA-binding transcriptional regulator YafY [Aureibacter tunicatorum]BDD05733.1 hypothetical protein AUTU_32160 [Aureibacter tunicatorum]